MQDQMVIKRDMSILIKTLSIIFVVSLIIVGLYFRNKIDQVWLEQLFNEYRSYAVIIYFLICLCQPIFLPFPEIATVFTGSILFGSLNAAIVSLLGNVIGITIMFILSRYIGSEFMRNIVKGTVKEKFDRYIGTRQLLITFILFIIPIFPDEIISICSGVTELKVGKFILITILAKIITSFAFSYSLNLIRLI